jgi:hypothetical protein
LHAKTQPREHVLLELTFKHAQKDGFACKNSAKRTCSVGVDFQTRAKGRFCMQKLSQENMFCWS